jgi:ribosome recycling factor
MSVSGEEIRQAKKFLENKKYSIKNIKPRLFASVAKDLKVKYADLLNRFEKAVNGGTTNQGD